MTFTADERRERHRLAVRRSRARETATARAERLRRNRERYESVSVGERHERNRERSRVQETPAARTERLRRDRMRHICVSGVRASADDQARALPTEMPNLRLQSELNHAWCDGNETPRLLPVSETSKRHCLQHLQVAFGAVGLDETTCAVCDRCQPRTEIRVIQISDAARIQNLHDLLSSDGETLPAALLAEYDCSNLSLALKGILLSKRGVSSDGDLQICQECDDSLLKKRLIPKFSIKNGFFVGTLPSRFLGMTVPERLMTQTVSIVSVTRVMRGGAHRAIRSHCLVFDATPGPPATLLPIPVDNVSSYRVVLAGPFTTEQQARVRQMHRVRRQVVDDVLCFYRRHNVLYNHVVINCSNIPIDVVAENLILKDTEADLEATDMDAEHDRVGGVSDNSRSNVDTDVIESRLVFISDDHDVSTQDAPPLERYERSRQRTLQPQFLVRHLSQFAQQDMTFLARMFPHLFPYGRGHPGEPRHVPVGLNTCIRHYAMLSSRRFAEDEIFMLASFDYLSVQKMYTQLALKCQRNPTIFEPYSDITESALVKALNEKELQRQGRTTAARDQGSIASAFLKSVEISGSAMWGQRRRACAMSTTSVRVPSSFWPTGTFRDAYPEHCRYIRHGTVLRYHIGRHAV